MIYFSFGSVRHTRFLWPFAQFIPTNSLYLHKLVAEEDYLVFFSPFLCKIANSCLEESGIEPETFRMRSGRSTTELHPHNLLASQIQFR